MSTRAKANRLLALEARALLTRLEVVRPFALLSPMVTAAAVSPTAQAAIDDFLSKGRRELHSMVTAYLDWLQSRRGRAASPRNAQHRFTILKIRFNNVLTQFDIFADVLNQRSEHGTGVWLSGLDAVATDALVLRNGDKKPPPVICYLDRGHGAAIRRARTRLPGGAKNPVAVIRVPRERMMGSGIASSLVHEVGHQGAALLDLVNSLRPVLKGFQRSAGRNRIVWVLWERWISEIIADFWSIAKVGVASTLGLMGVVSLPRAFVFRIRLDDPHPFPWIRVKLSCAIGSALYPHPQWQSLARIWSAFYPLADLDPRRRHLVQRLESGIPGFVALLMAHRPRRLHGASLAEAMGTEDRRPARLATLYQARQTSLARMGALPPTLACAVVGQARMDGRLTPEDERHVLSGLLTHWALQNTNRDAGTRQMLTRRRITAAA